MSLYCFFASDKEMPEYEDGKAKLIYKNNKLFVVTVFKEN